MDDRDILLLVFLFLAGVLLLLVVGDIEDSIDNDDDDDEHVLLCRLRSTFRLFLFGWDDEDDDDDDELLWSSITFILDFLRLGLDTVLVRGISNVAAFIFILLSYIVDVDVDL